VHPVDPLDAGLKKVDDEFIGEFGGLETIVRADPKLVRRQLPKPSVDNLKHGFRGERFARTPRVQEMGQLLAISRTAHRRHVRSRLARRVYRSRKGASDMANASPAEARG
jgi:hypothetical protein